MYNSLIQTRASSLGTSLYTIVSYQIEISLGDKKLIF